MSFTNQQLIGIGIAGVLALWYLKSKAEGAAKAVGEAVDITSDTNLASRGAEAWWGGGSDGQGSIGTDFYDWWNGIDG